MVGIQRSNSSTWGIAGSACTIVYNRHSGDTSLLYAKEERNVYGS